MNKDTERRQHTRLPKPYRLELAEFSFPLDKQRKFEAICEDVSAGGLAVTVPHRFEVGEKVLVRLYMSRLNKFHPGFFKVFESDLDQSLQAVAEVVRVEEIASLVSYRIGLSFTDVYEDDWRALHGLIQDEINRQKKRTNP